MQFRFANLTSALFIFSLTTLFSFTNPAHAQDASCTGTDVGTFASNPTSGSVTIGHDDDTIILTVSPGLAGSALAGFSANPAAGGGVSITDGSNVLSLTAVAARTSTGTVSITRSAGTNVDDTITVASNTYKWVGSAPPPAVNQIYHSAGAANAARNLVAAIMGNAALCGDANCINAAQTKNPGATATVSGDVVTVTNATGAALPFYATFANPTASETLSPALGKMSASGVNWCGTSNTGTFLIGATAADTATNFGTALNACPSAAGVMGTVGTGSNQCGSVTMTPNEVCVIARTEGAGGNAIALGTFAESASSAGGTATATGRTPTADTSITIGSTVYTWRSGTPNAANELEIAAGGFEAAQNFIAVLNANPALCYTSGCVYALQSANPQAGGVVSSMSSNPGAAVVLTALAPGTTGNSIAFKQSASPLNEAFALSPTSGDLGGGANSSGTLSNFTWTCNGAVTSTLCGGASGVNTATSFATDGNVDDDAANLAQAINRDSDAVAVAATAGGNTVTVCGEASGSYSAGSNAPGFSWASETF